jgi:hypothetical protein
METNVFVLVNSFWIIKFMCNFYIFIRFLIINIFNKTFCKICSIDCIIFISRYIIKLIFVYLTLNLPFKLKKLFYCFRLFIFKKILCTFLYSFLKILLIYRNLPWFQNHCGFYLRTWRFIHFSQNYVIK